MKGTANHKSWQRLHSIPSTPWSLRHLFILMLTLLFTRGVNAQTITLNLQDVPIESAFSALQAQSRYHFVYQDELLQGLKPVSIKVNNAPLPSVLELLFSRIPLTYSVEGNYIVVKQKEASIPLTQNLTGKVTDEKGQPLARVSIALQGTNRIVLTGTDGRFTLKDIDENATLIISSVGYQSQVIKVAGKDYIEIRLVIAVSTLDETVLIAYGTSSRRLTTGDVSKVSGEEISRQPISNPLAALEGSVPGLIITQSNGVPGSGFKVQLRGQSSIGINPGDLPPNDPLIIIDGIPFAPNNNRLDNLSFTTALGSGGHSPFAGINPSDIESIEVLKDADATAIYGSRGANGVVLITTKKGKEGKTKVQMQWYSGISRVTRTMPLMNTVNYLQLRHEAFANDGVTPDASAAPDLFLWDTTRYTDFKKMLIGHSAHLSDGEVSFSGGTRETQFLIGGGYHRETTVFPGDLADNRGSAHFSLNHASSNKKFDLHFSTFYTAERSNLMAGDLTGAITLAPNAPALYDSVGRLNWQENGYSFQNPIAFLKQTYHSATDNLLSSLQVNYQFLSSFRLKTSFGYNTISSSDVLLFPIASQDLNTAPVGFSNFGTNRYSSWIMEPQITYEHKWGRGMLNGLVGGTLQQMDHQGSSLIAQGYNSDDLLKSLSAAPSVTAFNSNSVFHYLAFFGRLNYNLLDKYLLTLSGRRDGSSRFGPGHQFGNFGAVGGAWIFSKERFWQNGLPFISFGKIRGSYGTTGNDQIGDYKYLDSWTTTRYPYGAQPGLIPTQLANPDYNWEVNHKLEGALDLGFLKDRVYVSIAYYRNRSSNQLLAYKLPSQTGFTSIAAKNFPAVVQNRGVELTFQSKNVAGKNFSWNTSANLTLPYNTLLSFPGLSTSSYYYLLEEGKSLSLLKGYHFTGVDPVTGIFQFEDINKDGVLDGADQVVFGNLDPKFYGGLRNTFTYKAFELDVFLQFKKGMGRNYLADIYSQNIPGTNYNQPQALSEHWRRPGDQTMLQQVTTTPGTTAYNAIYDQYLSSDALYSDASFIRLKNVYLSYTLPEPTLKRLHVDRVRLFLSAENIATLTSYKGNDPETQNFYALPPLKTGSLGISIQF